MNGNILWQLELGLGGLMAAFIHELGQNGIENNKTKHP